MILTICGAPLYNVDIHMKSMMKRIRRKPQVERGTRRLKGSL